MLIHFCGNKFSVNTFSGKTQISLEPDWHTAFVELDEPPYDVDVANILKLQRTKLTINIGSDNKAELKEYLLAIFRFREKAFKVEEETVSSLSFGSNNDVGPALRSINALSAQNYNAMHSALLGCANGSDSCFYSGALGTFPIRAEGADYPAPTHSEFFNEEVPTFCGTEIRLSVIFGSKVPEKPAEDDLSHLRALR